jgi:hypothetical protein
MSEKDPRVVLSGELLPGHALAAVSALDDVLVRVVAGESDRAVITAAALLTLVARSHAHVEVVTDTPLRQNPWGAASLSSLLADLQPMRPSPQAQPTRTVTLSTTDTVEADWYITPSTWTVSVCAAPASPDAFLEAVDNESDMTTAPYGGLFGAAIAAANLFCSSLGPLGLTTAPRRNAFTWNLLDYSYRPAPEAEDHTPARAGWPPILIAGCGSVGSSAAAALACDDLTGLVAVTVDSDTFDPARNAFRYPASTPSLPRSPKAEWLTTMLSSAGARATPLVGPVRDWTTSQDAPGFDGVVLSSVDDVDGRYEVADILARTTLSAAVAGLSFHVQREHLGDGSRCPFCDFVTVESPLAQAAADARLTGLPERRIVEVLFHDERLQQQDVDQMVSAGRLQPQDTHGLVGARLADLRNRLYAQAAIPAPDPDAAPPAPLSGPFVSWASGVLLAVELAKNARGLAPVERRVEVDLHGYPADFVHSLSADSSGRCACARNVRRQWMQELYAAK